MEIRPSVFLPLICSISSRSQPFKHFTSAAELSVIVTETLGEAASPIVCADQLSTALSEMLDEMYG